MKILIIEDDYSLRKTIRKGLKLLDYTVVEAENGVEGVIQAVNYQPDLVLLDLILPKMNGLEVIKEFRIGLDEFKETPIIVISAKAEKEYVLKAIQLGANDYIAKPFALDDLLKKIQKLL